MSHNTSSCDSLAKWWSWPSSIPYRQMLKDFALGKVWGYLLMRTACLPSAIGDFIPSENGQTVAADGT